MLYIIGGVPRSGKSILAHRLLKEKLIPYFPLDGLIGMLKNSAPEHGVAHEKDFVNKSEKAWKFNSTLFKYLLKTQDSYAVEGDCILPKHIFEIQEKYSEHIKCCFIGYCSILPEEKLNILRKFNMGEKDWTHKHEDEVLLGMIEEIIEHSAYLKKECEKYNIKFFDVSEDFKQSQEEAFKFLMSEN